MKHLKCIIGFLSAFLMITGLVGFACADESVTLYTDLIFGDKTYRNQTIFSWDVDESAYLQGFGAVTSVEKAIWDYNDNGVKLFPKNSYATVLDVETGKSFQIYRWSGVSHADCVPATTNDTRIMCEIVGFPYSAKHPTSSQLAKIKADGNNSTPTYTWPDWKNNFGSGKNIGSAWDARAALLNVNGKVYPVGIYGMPHGFTGEDSFSNSKFVGGVSDNMYFYAANNYYGMMCIHFVGSKTHSGNVSADRQAAIDTAWNYAKTQWPDLCK